MSYDIGIGMTKASMPMKCIAHIPPPIVIAAATSHARRASPRAAPTCPPRSRAVYDAKEATRMDRATRYGLYVPVTTIGIAPIFGPETNGRSTDSPANAAGNVIGAPPKANVGRRSPDDLVREHQDAPLA